MQERDHAVQALPVKRGFGLLPCPKCGDAEARILVRLEDVGDGEAIQCQECEGVFSVNAVRDLIAKWAPVLAWLDTAPPLP